MLRIIHCPLLVMIQSSDHEDSTGSPRRSLRSDGPQNGIEVCQLLYSETVYPSPIDINITNTIPVEKSPLLEWVNYEVLPKKMKVTNTGHTVILSGKWQQERPYLQNGALSGKYVFSQIHFHWGVNAMQGSEHTIDGGSCPLEMHVVHFKSSYLTQESALKEKDGIVTLVYFFKLQDATNPDFQTIVDAIPGITKAHSSVKIQPIELGYLLRQFESDYFLYRGSVTTTDCTHYVLWLICRSTTGVSNDQIDSLRYLMDDHDELIKQNFRPTEPINNRKVFHILPSTSKFSTLLPTPPFAKPNRVSQVYFFETFYAHDSREQKVRTTNMKKKRSFLDRTISAVSKLSKYMDFIYH